MKTLLKSLICLAVMTGAALPAVYAQMWNPDYVVPIKSAEQLKLYRAEGDPIGVKASTTVEVAFNPESSKMDLILKTIESAKTDIHIMAGEFSASTYTKALRAAMKRGVRVDLIVDATSAKEHDTYSELSDLVDAGAAVLVSSAQKSQTDRVIVVDKKTVALGGFDFDAAKLVPVTRKVESVTVLWDAPEVAAAHLLHRDILVFGVSGNKTYAFKK